LDIKPNKITKILIPERECFNFTIFNLLDQSMKEYDDTMDLSLEY